MNGDLDSTPRWNALDRTYRLQSVVPLVDLR